MLSQPQQWCLKSPDTFAKKSLILAGLEPAIPWFVVRCLVHWATGPLTLSLGHGKTQVWQHCNQSWNSRFSSYIPRQLALLSRLWEKVVFTCFLKGSSDFDIFLSLVVVQVWIVFNTIHSIHTRYTLWKIFCFQLVTRAFFPQCHKKAEPWVIRTAQTKVTTKSHILTQLWHIFDTIFRRVWHNFHASIMLTFILGVLACSHDASFSSRPPEYAGKSCHFYLGPHAKPLSGVTMLWHDLHQQQEKSNDTIQ